MGCRLVRLSSARAQPPPEFAALLPPGPSRRTNSSTSASESGLGVAASAQSSFAGYCSLRSPTQASTAQCSAAGDIDTCSLITGCRWDASCQQESCAAGDRWCQGRVAARSVCVPLTQEMLEEDGVESLVKVSMGG